MLKSVVTDIESVDENLRAFYIERDGKHVLNVEPVDGMALENVGGLKSALAAERRKVAEVEAARQAVEESLARFGGMDPVKAQDALNRINAGNVGPNVERAVAERVESMRASIAEAAGTEARSARAELDTVRGTLTKREAQLQKLARDSVITSELARVKPLDDATDALIIMAGQHVKMVEDDGELVARVVDRKGDVRLDASGKPMSVRAFMAELRDTRPSLFSPTDTVAGLGISGSAGGAGPGIGPNPWAKGQFNLTHQVMIQSRDPSRAAQLKAQAGV